MFKTCRTTRFVVQTTKSSSSILIIIILVLVVTQSTFIPTKSSDKYFTALAASIEPANSTADDDSGGDGNVLSSPISYGNDGSKSEQTHGLGWDKSARKESPQETKTSQLISSSSQHTTNNSRHSLGKQGKSDPTTTDNFSTKDKLIDASSYHPKEPKLSSTTSTSTIQDAHREIFREKSGKSADHAASAAQKFSTRYNNLKNSHYINHHHYSSHLLLANKDNNIISNLANDDDDTGIRHKRHLANQDSGNPECETIGSSKPALYALRCDDAETTPDGAIIVRAHVTTKLILVGRNLYSNLTIALTEQESATQDDCTHMDRIKSLRIFNLSNNIAEVDIDLPPPEKQVPYYFCIREDHENARWFHQGSDPLLKIYVKKELIPLWFQIMLIAGLLSLSGLFSGLNLGLMSLDKNELQVIMKCGTRHEKKYAESIAPIRSRGNYLLCSILLSNTLVNSTISVFLEDLSSGPVAIVSSTILIVLFGEILPQAFCSRHGLAVGAKTIWLTQACMFITAPLSYLISYCLDWALGEEIGHAYDRDRLMEFIRVTKDLNDLYDDEVNIIAGALKIKSVQIGEVMTRIEDVYMIDMDSKLDFDTMQEIVSHGYSRIPVHKVGNRREIEAILFAKDLALVDPDDETPVRTIINFNNHPRMYVHEDTTLDKVLNEFKTGRSHLAIVRTVVCDSEDKDPRYEVTGIVTLEDVIEEIIQMEINDETDTVSDNRRKRRRKDAQVRKDFSQFTNLGSGDSSFNVITPQLTLAAYQYLATTVEPFTPKYLSDSILRRLLSQKIFYKVKGDDDESLRRLYSAGEPADYFIMILEGRVHVVCGKESLVFDGGPFSFFGKAALTYLPSSERTESMVAVPNSTNLTPVQLTPGSCSAAGQSGRRESTKPMLSRRESLAKIVTSSLGVAKKPSNLDQVVDVNVSPTSTSGAQQQQQQQQQYNSNEMLEMADRGLTYFRPDYTVEVIANSSYLKVTRNDYLTALKATKVERELDSAGGPDGDNQDTTLAIQDASPTLSIEAGPRPQDGTQNS